MSVQALAWVLEHSTSKATHRCVLMAIANHVDATTGEGWAYIDQLLAEANCSEDSYRRAVDALAAAGELEVDVRGGGSARMRDAYRPNLFRMPGYRATLDQSKLDRYRRDARPARPPQSAGDRPSQPAGVRPSQPADLGPPQSAGVPIEEPSLDPSVDPTPQPPAPTSGGVVQPEPLFVEGGEDLDQPPAGAGAKPRRELDERILEAAIDGMANAELAEEQARGANIRSERGWLAAKRRDLLAQHRDTAVALLTDPDGPAGPIELRAELHRAARRAAERPQPPTVRSDGDWKLDEPTIALGRDRIDAIKARLRGEGPPDPAGSAGTATTGAA